MDINIFELFTEADQLKPNLYVISFFYVKKFILRYKKIQLLNARCIELCSKN